MGGASKSEAPLAGIFGYIDNEGTAYSGWSPNQSNGSEAGMGSSFTQPWQQVLQGGGDNASFTLTPQADPRFAHAVSFLSNGANGEGSGGWASRVDGSKLPQTRFGDINRAAPVNAHMALYDPRMQYFDENYGQITPSWNVKPDRLNTAVQAALMSAAMAGMGYLGMPSFAGALVNGARSLGGGDTGGVLGALGGIAGSYFGMPSWMTSAGRLALSQALRNRKGG